MPRKKNVKAQAESKITQESTVSNRSGMKYKDQHNLYDLFMQAPIPIGILKGPNHVYEFSNPLTNKILNVENPVGKSIQELFPDNKEIIKMLDNTYKTGKPFTVSEYPINIEGKDKKIQTIYINATYQPLRDENNNVIGIMTTGVDVTDHVVMRSELQESETRFRLLADSSPMLMWVNGIEGCEFVNRAYLEYLGVHPKNVRNYDWAQFIHDKDRDLYVNQYLEAFNNRTIFEAQFRFRRADGRYRWMKSIGIPRFDGTGNFIGFVGSTFDIHEMKESEEALRSQSHVMRTISENAIVGLFLMDDKGCTTYMNPSAEKITGYSFEELEGKILHEHIHYKHPDGKNYPFDECPIGRTVIDNMRQLRNHEEYFIRKDGSFFPVLCSSSPIVQDGKVTGIVLEILDITGRKELERQKDDFLGIASHELKTPVTSLKAFGQVIQRRLAKAGDENSVVLLGKMDAQINKLTNLIQDLLDISKIEGGRLQFHEEYFAFDELVDEIVEEIQRTTERHKLTREGTTGKTIYGDRDRIGQVITNFLTNAIKYSPHEDIIIIKTTADKIDVQIGVQDFGVGIPKENLPHIFQRFYRVKGKTHDTVPGMGLGLYISSEIIKRQGGRIWVESVKGKGSRFCFSLPIKSSTKVQQKNTLVKEEMKHE
jgi:PAS domain S-box-containing protein